MPAQIALTNTKTGKKTPFHPINSENVRMYVCGPTVYDRAHLGNARSAVVFDLLFRVLRDAYGEASVKYARNFTDIDDKIIARAEREYPDLPANQAIKKLTDETTQWYLEDMAALGVLTPTHQPRATEFVAAMQADIQKMIDGGNAYINEGHVFFSAPSNPSPGALSGRKELKDETIHRIEPNPLKEHPADFVLWKPSLDGHPSYPNPWGIGGRPGWHIECSAMATRLLGETFDIHGGGVDLTFPHHDNEVAQAKCSHPHGEYAKTWLHNGMIRVGGQKMSKSLGNFTTVHDLLPRLPGGAIRLALLSAHYRANLDWTKTLEKESLETWRKWSAAVRQHKEDHSAPDDVVAALQDDMNTAKALSIMHALYKSGSFAKLKASMELLGISSEQEDTNEIYSHVEKLIEARGKARTARDFATSDRIRDQLAQAGVLLKDSPHGTTWELSGEYQPKLILQIKP